MPKKTKKQKQIARDHRLHLPLPVINTTSSPPESDNNAFHLNVPVFQQVSTHVTTTSIDEFKAIKRDLLKTLIITFGIILSELLLSKILSK